MAQHNSEPESALGRFNLVLDRKKGLIFFLKAFGIEFLITMVLVLVVFGAAADGNNAPSVKVLFYHGTYRMFVFCEVSSYSVHLLKKAPPFFLE